MGVRASKPEWTGAALIARTRERPPDSDLASRQLDDRLERAVDAVAMALLVEDVQSTKSRPVQQSMVSLMLPGVRWSSPAPRSGR
jgi:hypothetical protein